MDHEERIRAIVARWLRAAKRHRERGAHSQAQMLEACAQTLTVEFNL